jgi:periplasmic protein TonB
VLIVLTAALATTLAAAAPRFHGPWPPLPLETGLTDEAALGEPMLAVVLPAPEESPSVGRDPAYSEELPVCVRRVAPEYPALAREAEISGEVVTHVLVGTDGRVHDVQVDPRHSVLMLEDAATQAAREFTFIPALVNDRPVAVWVAVPFSFRLW